MAAPPPSFYFEKLYPLQDEVLAVVSRLDTGLYLTGGTAASRAYLRHRFSDDLDLFADDDHRFGLWAERVIEALARHGGWRSSCERSVSLGSTSGRVTSRSRSRW